PVVDEMISWMKESDAVKKIEVAGSFRRRKDTVGDLDLLVASDASDIASERFVSMPPIERVISHGQTRSTVYLKGHLQVDCRVIKSEEYGAALQYFTGSKEHNVKLRTIAVKQGYKLNEYGLYKRENDELVASESEEQIYNALGMQWIPPELRENRGEIEAALTGTLPHIIEYEEIKGDLHVHTKWSDGTATIVEMAEAAKKLGLKYIAICDHSKSLGIAHGLNEERLFEQGKEIDKINENLEDFKILKGIECDIKSDGSLDFSSTILKELDFVVASIHSGFKSEADVMTERMIKAIHNEYVSTIGHPTGRIIQKRNPYSLDLGKVFEAAASQDVAMEINAFPDRLDLDDVSSQKAKEYGVKLSIGSDAHASNQIDFLKLGIAVARRGWLTAEDILNTKI
ncbi:DNA polymerase/3'-5' exonuclease PolX, partial [Candidatus Bathyarchaeota archaeon]|nr:DNA polymerase/3'-5' exonuclease PolX [Candidatus Bathyarchaeota archaeon]